ncbi:site-specific integrase [Radiobacillus sp. PE A8.2]|uniref:site-specific integrase n=1 Tax=Radiobacillus sp. PE A8.2 TaxID=3380349 RepID=UPI00388FD57D
MQLHTAADEFLMYLKIELNYSDHTLRGYDYDLTVFRHFLTRHDRSTDLDDLNRSVVRRFVQDFSTDCFSYIPTPSCSETSFG